MDVVTLCLRHIWDLLIASLQDLLFLPFITKQPGFENNSDQYLVISEAFLAYPI